MPRNKAAEKVLLPPVGGNKTAAAQAAETMGASATAKPKARKKQPVANPICKPMDKGVWRRVKNAAAAIPAPGAVLPSEWQWLQDQCRAVAALSFTAANVETMREALPRLRHSVARAYWQNVAAGKALCGTDPSPCANDRMMYAMLSAYDTERGARVQRTIRFEPVNDDRAALRLPPAGLGEGDFDGCSLTVGAELTCWTEIASWLSDSDRLNRITLPDTMPDRHDGDPEASTAGGPLEWVQRRQWAKYMADVCARLADADSWSDLGMPPKARKRMRRIDWVAKALLMVQDDPNITLAAIAKECGVHRGTVCKQKQVALARAAAKTEGRRGSFFNLDLGTPE